MTSNLPPMPEPEITPKEPNPGGADAIQEDDSLPPAVNELDPDLNPATEDQAPEEIKELEDTDNEATSDGASKPQEEDPA